MAFDDIRDLFAQTNEAKIRGYKKGRFSFNVKGGRCEACSGDGIIKIKYFLPDIFVLESTMDVLYNGETLEITTEKILQCRILTVNKTVEFFKHIQELNMTQDHQM